MIKQITQIEHVIGDRVYHFICDPNSQTNEVREALYKFLGYVDALEKKIAEAAQENALLPTDAQPKQENTNV